MPGPVRSLHELHAPHDRLDRRLNPPGETLGPWKLECEHGDACRDDEQAGAGEDEEGHAYTQQEESDHRHHDPAHLGVGALVKRASFVDQGFVGHDYRCSVPKSLRELMPASLTDRSTVNSISSIR